MEIIGLTVVAIVVIVAVVLLWRSTPKKSTAEPESEQDQGSEKIIDVSPTDGGLF
jgi:hypothetical protein